MPCYSVPPHRLSHRLLAFFAGGCDIRSALGIRTQGMAKILNSVRWGLTVAAVALTMGCQPTVRVEAPEKPIVINLNVKIEQEIRLKVEQDIDKLLRENKDLF